jgi:ribosomal protein S18 acetylase RimI-like enzyme
MLRAMSEKERLERLLAAAIEGLSQLVTPDPEPVTVLFLDAPGLEDAKEGDSLQHGTVEGFGGAVFLTDGPAFMAWLPNPAIGIATWLAIGAESPGCFGGLAQGLAHSHDLLRATTEEAAALAWLAKPGELMIPFELTNIVDLRDARFAVERTDKGSLVPWSCKLTLRKASSAGLRPLDASTDAEACDRIVAGLPGWFGLEQGRADCAEAVRTQQGLVAEEGGQVVGFLTYEVSAGAAEITWMGVAAENRRSGNGRALITALVNELATQGVGELRVKTISDRDPDPGYAETRAFYLAMGFTPERELDIWGPDNPAVLMVRRL